MTSRNNKFGILARDWWPQPEGQDAQPIWKGHKQTEQDRHMENNPAFADDGGIENENSKSNR
jgi:hypothetical protein